MSNILDDNLIEKLDTDLDPKFNAASIQYDLRMIKLKINEIIDAVNRIQEPEYTDDLDVEDTIDYEDDEDKPTVIRPSNILKK